MDEIKYIKEQSEPLTVQTTQILSCVDALDIEAVLFDIYGTLMISASGDIGIANKLSKTDAFKQCIHQLFDDSIEDLDQSVLLEAIAADHGVSREQGLPFPEVDIVEIWQSVLGGLGITASADQARAAAIQYECATNPVWPMPNLTQVLACVQAQGIAMGIISNAQFYTPLLFPALIDKDLDACGFDKELRWYSYASKRAKPDTWMYEQARAALAARGIDAEHVLYVGNDMLNDMWPAQQVGFKTALFAGDQRSLRLREDHEQASQVQVDCVLTDLNQLQDVLS